MDKKNQNAKHRNGSRSTNPSRSPSYYTEDDPEVCIHLYLIEYLMKQFILSFYRSKIDLDQDQNYLETVAMSFH